MNTRAIASVETFVGQGYEPMFDLVSLKEGVFTESTGWQFTIQWADGRRSNYRTNPSREGLFTENDNGSWRQIAGNGQSKIPESRGAAIAWICKRFGDEYSRMIKLHDQAK